MINFVLISQILISVFCSIKVVVNDEMIINATLTVRNV